MRRLYFTVALACYAIEEFYQWLYAKTVDGIIFLGPNSGINHKIQNTLNLQTVNFRIAGDGYNKLKCNMDERFSPTSIFLYANTKYNQTNNIPYLELCSANQDIDTQISSVINISSYTLPIFGFSSHPLCIEIFGNNSQTLANFFHKRLSDGLIIEHSNNLPLIFKIKFKFF